MRPSFVTTAGTTAALLCAADLFALDPAKAITQYRHDVWGTESGLPQHSIQAIVQTRDGYLWLGTQQGLVRFDGVRFTVFDRRNTPALRSDNVQALLEAPDGTLWISTGGGGLTRRRGNAFTTLTTENGLTSDLLGPMAQDATGTLWVGAVGGGLTALGSGGPALGPEALRRSTVHSLLAARDGALWIGTDGEGLFRWKQGALTRYTSRDGLSNDTIHALLEDHAGRLWIGTGRGGLNVLEQGRFRVYGPREGFPGDRVEAMLEDRQGSLWIATYGAGLVRFFEGRFSTYATRDGLSSDNLWSLLEDEEGSLWIGTRGAGLDRLSDGRFTTYARAEGLPTDTVWSILEDVQGTIWVATDGGGLARLRDGRFTTYTVRDGLTTGVLRSLAEAPDGSLWIGTWGGGVNRLAGGRFTAITTAQGLAHDVVRALYVDRARDVWIGTYGGGLDRWRNGKLAHFGTAEGLSSGSVFCVLEDRQGRLWVGTRGGGLNVREGGRFRAYTRRDGLGDDIVLSLHEDGDGALWIGTVGGLNRLHNGRLTHVGAADGLFDDIVYVILDDGLGYFWMSSNRGIFRVRKAELDAFMDGRLARVTSVAYGTADGMKSAECNGGVQPAGWRTRDGRLWFPTLKGVAVIDPRRLTLNRRPPPVHVERVLIDGRDADPTTVAEAPPAGGRLEFHYTALALRAPEGIRFRYRLEGFDPDWVEAGSRRVAYYTNMPHGRYAFRVTAANEDGIWNEQGASFRFRIAPHVYQTGWFRALMVLAVAAGAAALYAWRVRMLRERHRELEALVEARTTDLRAAIRVRDELVSMVAHDFRSPLTLIHGYSELLASRLHPDDETRQMLNKITAQARHLASMAEDTLSLSRIEGGGLVLRRAPLRVDDLTTAVAVGMNPARLQVLAEGAEPDLTLSVDRGLLQEVLENLLDNGLKYSPSDSLVSVLVRGTPAAVEIAVTDRGPGIAPHEVPLLFQRFSRLPSAEHQRGTGLGLYICRTIVAAHGGEIRVESEPGRGATFRIRLPRAPATAPERTAASGSSGADTSDTSPTASSAAQLKLTRSRE